MTITHVTCGTAIPAGRLRAIKGRQRAMWASGDFAVIGATLQIVGELLNEAVDVCALHDVLDVAAGSGNATLAAARRFACVTSTDYVPALLERGRIRAEAEGFDNVRFEVADAEELPYQDESFDVVLSTFGVMFAPDHHRAAYELMRVCRRGGRIGLTNWTPAGFVGDLFRAVARFTPPPAGTLSPLLWGTESHVRALFPDAAGIEHTVRNFAFRYRSPEHWVEVFRNFYGPTYTAFQTLDVDRQLKLEQELVALLESRNRAGRGHVGRGFPGHRSAVREGGSPGNDGGLVVDGEYLETVITRL